MWGRHLRSRTRVATLAMLVAAISACERSESVLDSGIAASPQGQSIRVDFAVVDVALASDLHTLAIADGDNQHVVIGDLHSDRRTVVGREGDGPCEFRHLSTLAFADSTTLAVTDAKAGLIALCRLDGSERGAIRIPGGASRVARDDGGPLRVAVVAGDDSVLALAVGVPAGVLDTTAVATIGAIVALVGPRPRAPVLAPLVDGRLAFGSRGGGYVVGIAGDSGARLLAALEDLPARYSAEQVQGIEQRTTALLARTGRPVPASAGFMKTDSLPLKPRFTGRVFASTPGTLWALASSDTGSSTIDRFQEPSGRLLARDRVPGGADGIVIRDTVLIAWRRNPDGTSTLMQWAIDRVTGAMLEP